MDRRTRMARLGFRLGIDLNFANASRPLRLVFPPYHLNHLNFPNASRPLRLVFPPYHLNHLKDCFQGVMEDGQEVAVNRLSRTSTQGLSEFQNEVITISKLQMIIKVKYSIGRPAFTSSRVLLEAFFIFGGNQIEANTKRVVGTYGYMAPEYAADGLFSIKSDVFSFGVLVLEIVSGKRNRGFFHEEHNNNLIGHSWELQKEGKSLELVAASLYESINISEVQRSIHVDLLCVQQRPEDRPNISSVVLMFGSEAELMPPKQPGFFYEKATTNNNSSSSTYEVYSTNELTITMLNAR